MHTFVFFPSRRRWRAVAGLFGRGHVKKNRLDLERQSANSERSRHTSSHRLVSEENRSKKKITAVQTDVRQNDRKGNVSEDGADGRMEGRVWKQRVCRGEFRCYRFPHFSGSGSCSTLPLSLCSCSPMENDSLYCSWIFSWSTQEKKQKQKGWLFQLLQK